MRHSLYKITSLLLAVFMTFSCSNDFLELTPRVNELEENAYYDEDDAMQGVVAVYDALSVQNWTFVPLQSDVASDDSFVGGEAGGGMGQWQEIERGVISIENAAAEALWNRCYSGIYRANVYLVKEGNINWKDQQKRNRMRAEVLALRAYFYWDLARHYGWVPIIPEGESVLNLESYTNLPQSEPSEVYNYAVKDLMTAITTAELPVVVPDAEKGRVTKDMARVLLARVVMFYEDFAKPVLKQTAPLQFNNTPVTLTEIRNMMDEIIESNRYMLLSNYRDVFDWGNENNEESIFEWQYSEKAISNDWGGWGIDGNFSVVFFGPRGPQGDPTISAGWSFSPLSWSLLNEFESGDARYNVTVYDANARLTSYTKGFQNTGYFSYKYMPRKGFEPPSNGELNHNWPMNYIDMRYAEVLLIAAELHLRAGNGSTAADALNEVRTRSLGFAARKNSITMNDIWHERRVEFVSEGQRYWDLLRRGLTTAETLINASFVVPDGIPNASEFLGRSFNPQTYGMLPIPAAEIRLAPPGVIEQKIPAWGGTK